MVTACQMEVSYQLIKVLFVDCSAYVVLMHCIWLLVYSDVAQYGAWGMES